MQIELVCLDMAGTTVRDDGAVLAAFDEALAAMGLEPDSSELAAARDYARRTMGQSKIEVFRAIAGGDERRAGAANKAFERAYVAGLDRVVAVPGAETAIARLRSAGVKTVFTTGFSPSTRDALIDALGWAGLCDLALSPDDAGRGRPFPDMLLSALIRLEIDDVRAIAAVGDTTSDLLAGTRAGASIVAGVLTGAHDADELGAAPHTHLVPSVADLPQVVGRSG
ncbi:phosphonatase-like hydrolase [Phytoactinopolyspora halotolerans]|uniref:Phosphonatase-like hydrolase n=1 Tax=Phytoactinopolyspora halotolerans TaxID=1981512 RepID=A0A6L9S760_9ACTN|nr:phosphonatase-like hydrolase [Phytoactinopolyspora halotolerans]